MIITFSKKSLLDRIIDLWPSRKKHREKELKNIIEFLVKHPELPCIVENNFIPNGYGERYEKSTL